VPLPVVARSVPFQFTVELDENPLPFTVIVKPAPPAVALCGVTDEMLGTEFGVGFGFPPPVDPELPEPPDEQPANETRTAVKIRTVQALEVMNDPRTPSSVGPKPSLRKKGAGNLAALGLVFSQMYSGPTGKHLMSSVLLIQGTNRRLCS
jgi:hypothetical protein